MPRNHCWTRGWSHRRPQRCKRWSTSTWFSQRARRRLVRTGNRMYLLGLAHRHILRRWIEERVASCLLMPLPEDYYQTIRVALLVRPWLEVPQAAPPGSWYLAPPPVPMARARRTSTAN